MYINPFFLVKIVGQSSHGSNLIFGKPQRMPFNLWPQREGRPMHHLITIDLKNLKLLPFGKSDLLSIFFYPRDKSQPFEAVSYTYNDVKSSPPGTYPANYANWEQAGIVGEKIIHGYPFHQEKIELDQQRILELANSERAEFPEPLGSLRGTNSLIGGVPIWLQEPQIPKMPDGSNAIYLMLFNGFAEYAVSTPFEGVDLFFFLDKNGKLYTVAQS